MPDLKGMSPPASWSPLIADVARERNASHVVLLIVADGKLELLVADTTKDGSLDGGKLATILSAAARQCALKGDWESVIQRGGSPS